MGAMIEKTPKFKRRAEARPDEVLDAALELFLEKGFAAAKVEDVARRAGLSKGSVYLYFPSKDALLEGIVKRAIAPVADEAMVPLAQFEGDPRVAITMIMRRLSEVMRDPKRMAIPGLIMREASQFPQIAQMYRREVLDRVIPALIGLLQRGIDNGYLREVDPELTVRSIIGPIGAHLVIAGVFGIVPADGLAIDRLIENHLSILFDGLSAKSEERP
jgi:AcrR family transcriptional regulator